VLFSVDEKTAIQARDSAAQFRDTPL
jgi:hypothetical protein